MSIATWEFESPPLHMRNFRANRVQKNAFLCRGAAEHLDCRRQAEIAQLVEHNLAKVGVAGPSPVFRSFLLRKTTFSHTNEFIFKVFRS